MTLSKITRDENGIRLINGIKYPSVTTILKGEDNYYKNIPAPILEEASRRGNCVHKAMEDILNGKDGVLPEKYHDVAMVMLKGLNKMSEAFTQIRNASSEKTVWHEELIYSGQYDLGFSACVKSMIDRKRRRVVVDFKTSAKRHDNHLLQVAGYCLADWHMRVGAALSAHDLEHALRVMRSNGDTSLCPVYNPDDYIGVLIYSHPKFNHMEFITGKKLMEATMEFIGAIERYAKRNAGR